MLLFRYFIARSFVLSGMSLAACSTLNAGGKVGLLSTLITRGATVCLCEHQLAVIQGQRKAAVKAVKSLNRQGTTYYREGNYGNALKLFKKAIAEARKSAEQNTLLATALHNACSAAEKLDSLEEAMSHIKECYEIRMRIPAAEQLISQAKEKLFSCRTKLKAKKPLAEGAGGSKHAGLNMLGFHGRKKVAATTADAAEGEQSQLAVALSSASAAGGGGGEGKRPKDTRPGSIYNGLKKGFLNKNPAHRR